MTMKEHLQQLLGHSRETEREFLASLTLDDRAEQGTYERWSARDTLAHTNYWQGFHSQQADAWARGAPIDSAPQFDQTNRKVYDRFSMLDWDAIEALAGQAHDKMAATLKRLEEEQITGAATGIDAQPFWQYSLSSFYTHKLLHYSDFYLKRGRTAEASKLWSVWAERVAPLDEGAEWQGSVHYNAACSLALAGEREAALASLGRALVLRPGLRSWSRRDSDLALLHDDPRYHEMFARQFWWEALEAGPLAEALADQFLRVLDALRTVISDCPEEVWRQGEAAHELPAGLALHMVQSIDLFSTIRAGEGSGEPLVDANWQDQEIVNLPTQEKLLAYLDVVEERLARFLSGADLEAEETLFPWTGSSLLARGMYALRHTEHHLANLASGLQRRGVPVQNWV